MYAIPHPPHECRGRADASRPVRRSRPRSYCASMCTRLEVELAVEVREDYAGAALSALVIMTCRKRFCSETARRLVRRGPDSFKNLQAKRKRRVTV
jgi:hypothetical protein